MQLHYHAPYQVDLLKQILKETDKQFLKWAVRQILKWPNTIPNKNIVHIHGTNDKLIPIKYVKPDHVVKDGGHLMVYTSAVEVSRILTAQLMGNA